MHNGFDTWLAACQKNVNHFLAGWLSQADIPAPLAEAIRHSLLVGGKRLRPSLVYATAALGDKSMSDMAPLAAAVECIHTYSLIHDDLPAMDDDDCRRGQPSCHIAYGEAVAILAGDALQTMAFDMLACARVPGLDAATRVRMVQALTKAVGAEGMIAGQVIDMGKPAQSLAELARLHHLKTGTLLAVAVEIGALAAALDRKTHALLTEYSQALGLAFQITDDCLDVTQSSAVLGKPQHSDIESGKTTYSSLLGLAGARQEARQLEAKACRLLEPLDQRADHLRALAAFAVRREH